MLAAEMMLAVGQDKRNRKLGKLKRGEVRSRQGRYDVVWRGRVVKALVLSRERLGLIVALSKSRWPLKLDLEQAQIPEELWQRLPGSNGPPACLTRLPSAMIKGDKSIALTLDGVPESVERIRTPAYCIRADSR